MYNSVLSAPKEAVLADTDISKNPNIGVYAWYRPSPYIGLSLVTITESSNHPFARR